MMAERNMDELAIFTSAVSPGNSEAAFARVVAFVDEG
jgi:hypothetical protein